MKIKLLYLIAVIATAGCNSSVNEVKDGSAAASSKEHTGPKKITVLQHGFKDFRKGGTFSGHPSIHPDGSIDYLLLHNDQGIRDAGGVLKVTYTYVEDGDTTEVIKRFVFGL